MEFREYSRPGSGPGHRDQSAPVKSPFWPGHRFPATAGHRDSFVFVERFHPPTAPPTPTRPIDNSTARGVAVARRWTEAPGHRRLLPGPARPGSLPPGPPPRHFLASSSGGVHHRSGIYARQRATHRWPTPMGSSLKGPSGVLARPGHTRENSGFGAAQDPVTLWCMQGACGAWPGLMVSFV